MKILITGGAGFIGSNLAERLLENGDEVHCLDNFYSSSPNNMTHLKDNPLFQLIEHDVTLPIISDVKFDQIYNLACPASPVWYEKDPIKTIATNVQGSINALEIAKKNSARIFQASTSEIYGDPLEHPQKETYRGNVNTLGPRSCYDEGKRVAETIFMEYHKKRDVDIRIVRIFNTYGPRMADNDGRVISNFILQALKNDQITIYGDGSQTRSFQYISDLISAIIKFMNTENVTGPINVGNPNEFTVKQLAERVIELTGSKSTITYMPLPQDDPRQRRPDISMAREILEWEPTVQLDDGLTKTIDYFRKSLG